MYKKGALVFSLDIYQTPLQLALQLANPTQLQLVGVGVDFVFPRKKEEGRKNPQLNSRKRNDPTCLNFGDLYCVTGLNWSNLLPSVTLVRDGSCQCW